MGIEDSELSKLDDRDLTGFIDGSENPTLFDAPIAALLPEGVPGHSFGRLFSFSDRGLKDSREIRERGSIRDEVRFMTRLARVLAVSYWVI